MAQQDIVDRVTKVTARVLGLEAEKIKPGDAFASDLGAESVQSLELIAAFEEEFNIEMDEDAALAIKTVGSAAEFVAKHLNR